MRWLIVVSILLGISAFPQSAKALEYYSAGMSAYLSGDYDSALKWFEKALTLSPDIESYDPKIKLKMGISAFMIGDYETARDFLKLFPDDVMAKSILKIIEQGIPESEWEKWLMIPKETEVQVSTPATAQTVESKGKSPFLIFLGIFVIVFAALMILELKFSLLTSLIARIPRIKIVVGKEVEVIEKPKTVVEIEEEVPEQEIVEEKELELSFEEIMKSPLETVDRLIYGSEAFGEEEVEEGVEEEVETEEEVPQEEVETAREEPVEEPSTSEIIQELVGKEEEEESSEEDILKKSQELIEKMEPEEEGVDLEETLSDVEELMESLEEKEEYTPEDADRIVKILKTIVHDEEKVS